MLVWTGIVNLAARGIGLGELQQAAFWQGSFGSTLAVKLVLVAAILLISAFHDFSIGPRAASAWQSDPGAAETLRLRRLAAHLERLNLLLALVLIALGVILVRGPLW